jgi:hypothetical protein
MEAARTLKANLKLEGKPCGWCQAQLALGDDAAVCTACEAPHHRGCWDTKAGCSKQGCASAPLRRLDAPPAGASAGASAPASPFPTGFAATAAASSLPAGFAPSAPAPSAPPPGMIVCPRCSLMLAFGTPVCPGCRAITSPDGLYYGPRINAPGAVASLVLGIIGLVFCGVVLGPLAIWQASTARSTISRDPMYGGGGMAIAGLVLGIIALIMGVFVLISFMIGFSQGLNR